jgi:ketosteroid isomerase-like protein
MNRTTALRPDTASPGEMDSAATTTLAQTIAAFESLTPASVSELGRIYAADARFIDPFNDVQGLAQVQAVFRHMFETLEQPRFVVTGKVVDGDQCFLLWDFHFRFRAFRRDTPQTIAGTSHLRFDTQGRITLHQDYWDAAHGLYQKMPVLGALMRWLRRHANS